MKILSFKTLSLSLGMMALSALPVMASDPGPEGPPVSSSTETKVIQVNDISITNLVAVVQNTGGDAVSGVTCGDATITTGKTVADIQIVNVAGGNAAAVDTCNTCEPTVTPTPEALCGTCNHEVNHSPTPPKTINTTVLVQKNETKFTNGVLTVQNTGLNLVKGVTKGSATITTGNTKATIKIRNLSGLNLAKLY